LAGKTHGLSTSDLSRRLRIPKSSTSYLLRTLVARGYVRRDFETGFHTLGIKLLSLGGQAMQGLELRDIAMPHLRHIVERTQLDTHLAILDHGDAVYIERIESPGFIKMATWIGRRMVPHVTGVGKALICCHDRAAVEAIVAIHPLKAITPNTITTMSRLMAELEKTRQRGFAIDDEEHEARVRCVAAPIFAASGEVVAAIGVSGTAGQLSDEIVAKIGNLVRTTSLKFSSQLGGRKSR
jgi:IclR family acetate operon transcriptional repressor